MDTAGVDHCLPIRICGASGVLVCGFSECSPSLRPCTISPRGCMFFPLVAKFGVDLMYRGSAADRIACTNVSMAEFTLTADTSSAWVMRAISFSLSIQSSFLMLARKLSCSRSSHKSLSVFSDEALAVISADTPSYTTTDYDPKTYSEVEH